MGSERLAPPPPGPARPASVGTLRPPPTGAAPVVQRLPIVAGGLLVAAGLYGLYRCMGGGGPRRLPPVGTLPQPANGQLIIPQGTLLFHGTRWQSGQVKWWEGRNPFPNRVDEDGGVSLTLDYGSTPKVRNAHVVLVYRATTTITAVHCASKAGFHAILSQRRADVCYTFLEREVKFRDGVLGRYLAFDYAVHQDQNVQQRAYDMV